MLPANGSKRLVALATYAITSFSTLGGVALWVDARYAKADEVAQLRSDIRCLARDVKLGQLRTREALIIQETTALEVARQSRRLSQLELQRANDLAAEHGQLLSERRQLETMKDCR